MGGKPILRVWMQDSDDLTNSLLSLPVGGHRAEDGLKGLVLDRYHGAFDVELIRGCAGRSDLLLQRAEAAPMPLGLRHEMLERGFDLAEAAPQSRLFGEPIDVAILSLRPELLRPPWRHRDSSYLFKPPDRWQAEWTPPQMDWFQEQFIPSEPRGAEVVKAHLLRLIRVVKERVGSHLLVYNCSPIDPQDRTHNYHGLEDTLAVRIQTLNLVLIELSMIEGVSIVDVERIVAELGQQHVPRALVYSAEARRAICEEVLRILGDIGFFEARPLVPQLGRRVT